METKNQIEIKKFLNALKESKKGFLSTGEVDYATAGGMILATNKNGEVFTPAIKEDGTKYFIRIIEQGGNFI